MIAGCAELSTNTSSPLFVQARPPGCQIFKCFGTRSSSMVTTLLCIINFVILCFISRVRTEGFFQALAKTCLEAVLTYNRSLNCADVKSLGLLFKSAMVRSG